MVGVIINVFINKDFVKQGKYYKNTSNQDRTDNFYLEGRSYTI